jgi:Trk K+ transport system NAD-binding subunit
MGKIILKEMKQNKASFVVIEQSSGEVALMDRDVLVVQGDSTRDSVLKKSWC